MRLAKMAALGKGGRIQRRQRPVVMAGAADSGGDGSGRRRRALANVKAAGGDDKSGRQRQRRSEMVEVDSGGGGSGGRVWRRLPKRLMTMGRDAVGDNGAPPGSADGVGGDSGRWRQSEQPTATAANDSG